MRRTRLFCLALCLLWVMGCTVPTPQHLGDTPAAQPSATPAARLIYAFSPIKASRFGKYAVPDQAVKPSVPAYDPDPALARNADRLAKLTAAQQATLTEQGFVIVPADHDRFYDIYKQAAERGQPVFVTTDVILHAYHIFFDHTLRYLETEQFAGDLNTLNRAMISAALEQMQFTRGAVQQAARRNLAFFTVADILLNPSHQPPAEVADWVRAELANIEAHQGLAPSAIFGYEEDYGQYVPRGHYTRSEALQRYFRAMMWYGRIMFRLRPGDTTEAIEAGRIETRQALLITLALHHAQLLARPAVDTWERIYEPTTFFVGQADDLTVYDYAALLHQHFGEAVDLDMLNNDATLDALIAQAQALRPPQIVSSPVDDTENPVTVTQGFRLMGQRFIPDSYMFQQLVYTAVGTAQAPRRFPKGLDVPAVLGSQRAYQLLDQVFGETRHANYDQQLTMLQAEFAALDEAIWTQNLYWNWLHTLRALLPVREAGYPAFMRSPAWLDKDLNTFLGSWTELRHDTLLYAKQSYTIENVMAVSQPKPMVGYVEPNPVAFGRLAALITQMRSGLVDRGLLNQEYQVKLERLEELVLSLESIARKELANQPLSQQDADLLHNIGSRLEQITTFSAEMEAEITSEADSRVAMVADVHTDVNTEKVLQVAVGDVFEIHVLVPHPDHTAIAIGGIFSYHEFTQPMSQRLTDENWQALDPKPPTALETWAKR